MHSTKRALAVFLLVLSCVFASRRELTVAICTLLTFAVFAPQSVKNDDVAMGTTSREKG